MKHVFLSMVAAIGISVAFVSACRAQESSGPDSHLPPNIERLSYFGERTSWSPDGRRIAFMSKSFGDAFEIDLATGHIRLLTPYPSAGYLRVQYLPNGDYLLIGAASYHGFSKTRYHDQEFWLLKADGDGKPIPLHQKVSEGVAIARKSMKIAWAEDWRTSPSELAHGVSAIYTADIVYDHGQPKLVHRKRVVQAKVPECRLEAQDFRNDDNELIYVCYRDTQAVRMADIYGVNLTTGKTTVYRKITNEYNEAEGIFPDGRYTLVESSRGQAHPHGSKTIDIWKLRLEPGSQDFTRLTHFGDYPGYKASNPVVSPDGKTVAFQEGRSSDPAGVGHGIFLLHLK